MATRSHCVLGVSRDAACRAGKGFFCLSAGPGWRLFLLSAVFLVRGLSSAPAQEEHEFPRFRGRFHCPLKDSVTMKADLFEFADGKFGLHLHFHGPEQKSGSAIKHQFFVPVFDALRGEIYFTHPYYIARLQIRSSLQIGPFLAPEAAQKKGPPLECERAAEQPTMSVVFLGRFEGPEELEMQNDTAEVFAIPAGLVFLGPIKQLEAPQIPDQELLSRDGFLLRRSMKDENLFDGINGPRVLESSSPVDYRIRLTEEGLEFNGRKLKRIRR